jgi:hypothetical protein
MRKSYVMTYSPAFAPNHTSITSILDAIDPRCDWTAPYIGCLFFTSERTAHELAAEIEGRLGLELGRLYAILEVVGPNAQGRLTERAWRVITNPLNPRGM